MIDRELVASVKMAVAALAIVLLAVEWWLHRAGRPRQAQRLRDTLLAAAGFAALLCWWDLGRFHFERNLPSLRWVNFTDSFHYYMGAKYFPELGYTGLYECAAVAELELGAGARVARRAYRDLTTNAYTDGRTLLRDPSRCTRRFAPERWRVFVADVDYFRRHLPGWDATMQDWGYNATPVWNLVGSAAIGDAPVADGELAVLSLLDVPCLLAMWACVAWAFGWRAACVALTVWGTNAWSDYNWTGGSILRQLWLALSVIGVCLLKKRKDVAAGAAITSAALMSIFPGFLAVGVGLKALAEAWRQRSLALSREHRRLLVGAALALGVLVPIAAWHVGGVAPWLGFVSNSRVDSQPSPNNMGLPTLLAYGGDTLRLHMLGSEARPLRAWSEARQRTLAERRVLHVLGVAGLGVLLVLAVRGRPDWVAAVLGLGLVVFGFQLSNYYYSLLVPYALLWPRHRSVALAALALALASHGLRERWLDDEEYYMRLSALAAVFVTGATLVVWRSRDAEETPG